jgi:hypothetical protein
LNPPKHGILIDPFSLPESCTVKWIFFPLIRSAEPVADSSQTAGRWAWFVQVDAEGRPFNGGTGTAATGKEAREAVERLVPVGVRMRG